MNQSIKILIMSLILISMTKAYAQSDSFFDESKGESKAAVPNDFASDILGIKVAHIEITGESAKAIYKYLVSKGKLSEQRIEHAFRTVVRGENIFCVSDEKPTVRFFCSIGVKPDGKATETQEGVGDVPVLGTTPDELSPLPPSFADDGA